MVLEKQTYKNVMEILVDEEIEFQLKHNVTIADSASYLNLIEVATFALNRLPSLYASSQEGIERQKRKLRQDKDLKGKISIAVSQGFAAVERDPLRRSTPIKSKSYDTIEEIKQIITQLGDFLPEKELSWLINFMEQFLARVKNQQITEEEIIKLYYLLVYYWQQNQNDQSSSSNYSHKTKKKNRPSNR